jgi:hypothetical protein
MALSFCNPYLLYVVQGNYNNSRLFYHHLLSSFEDQNAIITLIRSRPEFISIRASVFITKMHDPI